MGKRSRKRTGSAPVEEAPKHATTRAERDAARARRAAAAKQADGTPARRPGRGERPPAPWGSFPLVELCVLLGIILLVAGFVVGEKRGATMVLAGLVLGSLGGLELSIREHFGGYRSHSTLLAGTVAILCGTLVAVISGTILLPVLIGVAVAVFAVCFYLFRQAFRRRSGGLSFR